MPKGIFSPFSPLWSAKITCITTGIWMLHRIIHCCCVYVNFFLRYLIGKTKSILFILIFFFLGGIWKQGCGCPCVVGLLRGPARHCNPPYLPEMFEYRNYILSNLNISVFLSLLWARPSCVIGCWKLDFKYFHCPLISVGACVTECCLCMLYICPPLNKWWYLKPCFIHRT